MKAKVFSKIGVIFVKIHEEEVGVDEIDRILAEWKNADLIEVFDGDKLVYSYTGE
jgi:hypothetical protein